MKTQTSSEMFVDTDNFYSRNDDFKSRPFSKLTDEQRIDVILDWLHFDRIGGYPQRVIENDKVYIAMLDHDDDPELIVENIYDFINQYRDLVWCCDEDGDEIDDE